MKCPRCQDELDLISHTVENGTEVKELYCQECKSITRNTFFEGMLLVSDWKDFRSNE